MKHNHNLIKVKSFDQLPPVTQDGSMFYSTRILEDKYRKMEEEIKHLRRLCFDLWKNYGKTEIESEAHSFKEIWSIGKGEAINKIEDNEGNRRQ